MKNSVFLISFLYVFLNTSLAQWVSQVSGTGNELNSVHFASNNFGISVGGSGTIVKTTNGGTNWVIQSSGTGNSLYSVSLIDINTGYACGSSGLVIKTTNAGSNWIVQASGTGDQLNSIYFVNATTGFSAGASGRIVKTTNGGTNWSILTSGTSNELNSITFVNASTGFAMGVSGTIRKTTNGGTNWVSQASGTSNSLYSVSFLNVNTGYTAGASGSILKTTNGGTNWVSQITGTSNVINSIAFRYADYGYSVGGGGVIYRTNNGGANWFTETSPTGSQLESVFIFDDMVCYSVGASGSVIKNPTAALPVSLAYFSHMVSGRNVTLRWETASETNNAGFKIERSKLSRNSNESWEQIGFLQGYGTTNETQLYSFKDFKLISGTYSYRLKQTDFNGNFEYFELSENVKINNPAAFNISQNYPNPSNPGSKIDFEIAVESNVKIIVYDITGREATHMYNSLTQPGIYTINFKGDNLASGVYYCMLIADSHEIHFTKTIKVLYLK